MPGSERRPLVPSNRRGTANPDLSQDALDCAGELPPILPLLCQLPFPAGRDLVGPPTSPTAVCRSAPDEARFLGGYQTWWRSGRDSNSRTGYAGYGISSAAPSTRLGDRSAASRLYPPSLSPERRPLP